MTALDEPGNTFPLAPGSQPVDLVFEPTARLLWHVDAQGSFGSFHVDEHLVRSHPKSLGYTGPVDCLTTWPPGDRVWTFTSNGGNAVFVSCGPEGSYTASQGQAGYAGARAHTVVVTVDARGAEALTAAPEQADVLYFFARDKVVTLSDDLGFAPFGLAVHPRDRGTCWLSDPGPQRRLATYESGGKVTARASLPAGHRAGRIAFDATGETLWVAATPDSGPSSLFAYSLSGNEFSAVEVPFPASRLTVAPDGGVWFTATAADAVVHVDAGRAVSAFPLGKGTSPTGLALVDGRCWVALRTTGRLVRLDHRLEVVAGEHQAVPPGQAFPSALKVRAVTGGVPQAGQTVVFAVTGPATFPGGKAQATAWTGADGVAVSPALTAGAAPGACHATATWSPAGQGAIAYLRDLRVLPH